MQNSLKETLMQISKLYELMQTMEEAYVYIQENKNSNCEVEEMFQKGIKTLLTQVETLFESNVNFKNEIDISTFPTWKTQFWNYVVQQVWKIMSTFEKNMEYTIPQCEEKEIQAILKILEQTSFSAQDKSMMRLLIEKFCELSVPVLSFQTLMKAFEDCPNLFQNSNSHLKHYTYDANIRNEQKEFTECPICGGEGIPIQNAPSYRMAHFGEPFLPAKLWIKCKNCHNLYTRYFPVSFLQSRKERFIIQPQKCDVYQCQNIPATMLANWGRILSYMMEQTKGNNLLEVGVGKGALIAVAKEFEVDIDCVDLDEERAQKIVNLLQVPVICCDFLELPEQKQYDMITMGDVIEHLSNPRKGLEKAYRLLKEDGIAWISTPNYESAYNQLHQIHTAMWSEPTHVTYFHRKSLICILKEIGFEILSYGISEHYNGSMELFVQKK